MSDDLRLTFIDNPLDLGQGISQKTALIAPGAGAKRHREFIAGRHCSEAALKELLPSAVLSSVGKSDDGAPLWPAGICGSITHSGGMVRAAVAQTEEWRSIGIDSERLLTRAKSTALAKRILTPQEALRYAHSEFPSGAVVSLIFSAKESLFKCLFPLCGVRFYYTAAEVVSLSLEGSFTVCLQQTLSNEFPQGLILSGHYTLQRGMVHTAVGVCEK